jgi:hypothetical protein
MQIDRQTEVQKDRQIQIQIQIYIQTNRNNDVQTYTDKQADRQTVQKHWYRLKNRQMYRKANIRYITALLYIRQTTRQTDRQDRQKRMTVYTQKTCLAEIIYTRPQ